MADNPSAGGGKIRSRRATSQRKPYSRAQKKSFFTKVSDSVKNILNPLTPRWLVNFRGNQEPQSSTQSDEQVEIAEDPSSSQASELLNHTNNNLTHSQLSRPPLKNFETSPSSSRHSGTYDVHVSEETRPKGVASGKEGLMKHLDMISKRARIDMDTPLTSDSSFLRKELKMLSTTDNASVASSSDCSSVQMSSQKADVSDRESIGKHAPSSRDTSLSNPPSTSRQQSTMGSSKRPRFNPAVFGMPTLGLSTPEPYRSSFYEGSVQFGGANASGRSPYFATPYKIPSVTKVKVRHVNHQRTPAKMPFIPMRNASLPLDESMSSTARKILQTLEKMSSPLNDARRIPTISRSPSSYAATRSRRQARESSLLQDSTVAPPITGLSSPSVAKLRRRTQIPTSNSLLKRKDMEIPSSKANLSNAETITNNKKAEDGNSVNFGAPDSRAIAARGLPAPIASMSSSAGMVRPSKSPFSTPNSSGGGKIKSGKRSSTHYTSLPQEDDEVERPQLPNVTLAVSSLPSFNFGSKEMTSTPTAPPPVTNSKSMKNADDPKFSFASPIVKTSQPEQPSSASDTPKFRFSLPPPKSADIQDAILPSEAFSVAPTQVVTPGPKVVSALRTVSQRTISPLATSDMSHSKTKTPESLKKGSVMDILGGKLNKEKDTALESKPLPLQASTSGWICEVCMIPNDESDNSCAACTTPKPNSSSKPPLSNALPVQQNKGWDCETCLVPNDASCENCVACGTCKPGSSTSTAGFKLPELSKDKPTFSFGVTSKTNTASSANTDKGTGFGFKSAVSDGASPVIYKFGVPSVKSTEASSQSLPKKSDWGDLVTKTSGQWECEVCMVSNSNDKKSCEACTSPKPGTKSLSNTSFKFGENSSGLFKFSAPTPKEGDGMKNPTSEIATQTSQSIVTSKPTEAAKPSFSFGVPTSASAPAKIVQFSSEPTDKVDTKSALSFGQKIEASQSASAKLPVFGIPAKKDTVPAPSQPAGTPPLPQSKGLAMFGMSGGSVPAPSRQTLPPIASVPVSASSVSFGNTAPAVTKSAPVPAFGTTGGTSSGIQLKPSIPATFQQSEGKGAESKSTTPAFTFGAKPPTDSQAQDTTSAKQTQPVFAFGAKSAHPVLFGGTTSQSERSSNVTSTTSGFGAAVGQEPVVKKSSPFMGAGAKFSGFGQSSGTGQAATNEPSKPVFGGFGTTASSASTLPSQPTGGTGGIFSSSAKPAPANPFGGASTQPPPAFGSASGSASTPFGAIGSSNSAFGNPPSNNVFGGAGGAGKSIFGQPPGTTAEPPKPTTGFGGSGTTGNAASGFGQSSSAATSSMPKPNLAFGQSASNTTSTTGGFSFGASNTQQSSSYQFGAGNQQTTSQPNAGFKFGSAPQNSGSGGFAFGGSSSGQNSGVFQFGAGGSQQGNNGNNMEYFRGGNQSGSSSAAQSTGFNFAASSTPSYNFTGSQQPGATPAFASSPSQNMFEPGKSTTPAQQRRVIKTARRKLRK